jgi:hypothetical protein
MTANSEELRAGRPSSGLSSRAAFISGTDLAMVTGAAVAFGGCLLALVLLPARPAADGRSPAGPAGHASGHGELRKGS